VSETSLTTCRASGSTDLRTVIDFGETPLAERLLNPDQLDEVDPRYPLRLVFCPESALVQITENVPPEILYSDDYPYYTSVSPALVEHFATGVREILRRKPLGPDQLVVEAASNDGHQLKTFQEECGVRTLGIDPASGPARAANEAGVETWCRFFETDVVDEIVADRGRADVITANNVLNLFQDLGDFIAAADTLLADDGLMVLEVPYFVDTVDLTAFDNVFHQNTTYWTGTSLDRFLGRHGFTLNDVTRIPTFGGSLRAFVSRDPERSAGVVALLDEEQSRGVDRFDFYAQFADRVASIKASLRDLIDGVRAEGARIVAYGAAGGMATTLLSYMDLDASILDYAVDINPHKHGLVTSGSRLVIHPVERLVDDAPDYALLLAWNHATEITGQQQEFRDRGGRFIVPIPEPHIV
jgi:hypothetical protein